MDLLSISLLYVMTQGSKFLPSDSATIQCNFSTLSLWEAKKRAKSVTLGVLKLGPGTVYITSAQTPFKKPSCQPLPPLQVRREMQSPYGPMKKKQDW